MAIAFLFPGQGSQSVGMGLSLAQAFPAARAALDEADAALGGGLWRLITEGPEEELKQTANTQPAILAVSVAAHRAFVEALGPQAQQPGFVTAYAGHSLGEYSALVAAGALSLGDAVLAVRARGTFMQEAVPPGEGAMAAILGLEPQLVAEACREASEQEGKIVSPANYNSPEQTVIAGHAPAVERAIAACKARGARRAMPLPVSAPFHCALMAPAADAMQAALEQSRPVAPLVPLVANVTAAKVTDPDEIARLLVAQVTATVRWRESVLAMVGLGVDSFVELGAGKVLAGLIRRIAPDAATASAGSPAEIEQLLKSL